VTIRYQLRRVTLVLVSLLIIGLTGQAGRATANTLPRFVPAEAAYQVLSSEDDGPRKVATSFVEVLRDQAGQREIVITATPTTARAAQRTLVSLLSEGGTKTSVRKLAAVKTTSATTKEVKLTWFEKNSLIRVYAYRVVDRDLRSVAAATVPTGKSDASFRLDVVPSGFTVKYRGQEAATLSDSAFATYSRDGGTTRVEYTALNVIDGYLDTFVLRPQQPAVATTIHGKPAYIFTAGPSLVWMEQPNLMIVLEGATVGELQTFGESLVAVDEATWRLRAQPTVSGTTPGGTPWYAEYRGRCFTFVITGGANERCAKAPASATTLIWAPLTGKGQEFATGLTGTAIVTVVAKLNGVEYSRSTTQPVPGEKDLRVFAFEITGPFGITVSGLDAAGLDAAGQVVVNDAPLP
jgi:hypothetical protein